jgi:4-diphosphocytidyl-2C-methyl-D-erythritol kinase
MESLEIKANAKINLALAVKHKRDDGYHEIELIYQEPRSGYSIRKEIANRSRTWRW